MGLTVGETIFYPPHGSAVIEGLETRTVRGEQTTYVVLRVPGAQNMIVRVPDRNLQRVGARTALDPDALDRLFAVLGDKDAEECLPWPQRCRQYADAVHSADVFRVAETLRNLWRRQGQEPLSSTERRLLAKARQMLIDQVAFSQRATPEQAWTDLTSALESHTAERLS